MEPETVFIVKCQNVLGTDVAECPDAESAYAARWQLPRDVAAGPTQVTIINVITGKVVFQS